MYLFWRRSSEIAGLAASVSVSKPTCSRIREGYDYAEIPKFLILITLLCALNQKSSAHMMLAINCLT